MKQIPLLASAGPNLASNTAWMLLGKGIQLLVQMAYFILMARSLGSQQYGSFVAVTAAASVLLPFVGNGSASLMIKNVARDPTQFAESFGNLLAATLVSGLALFGFLVVACLIILPRQIAPAIITLIVISNVLVVPYVGVAGAAFWSVEKLAWTAAINVFASLMHLIGIVAIVLLHRSTLMGWSIAYLATSMFSSVVALGCVLKFLGMPRLGLRRLRRELADGFHFSVGLSAQTIYNDIDKTMLARMATLDAVGIYAAAYRLADVVFLPVASLLSAAYPRFFRAGADGIHTSMKYGFQLLKRVMPYSLCVSAALLAGAPLVPWVLGPEYGRVTEALRWLAVLPVLRTMHYFVADSLTGAGHQALRSLVQVGVAAFNILVNLWAIPAWGWRGAAWSSIASDALLASVLWVAALYLSRRARSLSAPVPSIVPLHSQLAAGISGTACPEAPR
jgi:O-antigen/teichoic acid export membrane protein